MKKYLSLHIGVNKTDKNIYAPTSYSQLCGCVNDANAMRDVAIDKGFDVMDVLKDQTATFDAVVSRLHSAVTELKRGGTFLLTFSGHGAQLSTMNYVQEPDLYDEGFVLYDLVMKDNYLDVFLRRFAKGVSVIIVADCCHSRTIHSFGARPRRRRRDDEAEPDGAGECARKRRLDYRTAEYHRRTQHERYKALDVDYKAAGFAVPKHISADVIVLSACDDNEKTADGPDHGVFTQHLLDVLRHGGLPKGGPFTGSYDEFMRAIQKKIGNAQSPAVTFLGQNREQPAYPFFKGPPFTIKN